MSEPIPDVPDVVAARALVALIEMLHTDPIARPLLPTGGRVPMYFVCVGGLSIRYSYPDDGASQLAAAEALFGGSSTIDRRYDDIDCHVLTTTWQGTPFRISVEVRSEDDAAALRKQVETLTAQLAAARQGVSE